MPNEHNALCPFDHSALMDRVHRLADTYSFIDLSYIGTSVLDRAIPILHVGSGKRRLLYVGAHHGMEWITSLVLMQFAEEFCEVIDAKRRVCGIYPCDLLDGYTLSILPMLNPDGVEYQIHGVSEDNPLRERLLEMNGGSEDFSYMSNRVMERGGKAAFVRVRTEKAGVSHGRTFDFGEGYMPKVVKVFCGMAYDIMK